ncbi:MAG: trigger factor [Alphaproteobacteria bacterium]|nr:trigger factor [Alphaproteobacteria bacterium]MDE1967745.1 trigger factor [Alphaproteobacteria bacterium]MDE2513250.1 trigger factor [Alphaproteobacteria bacterium]
MQVRETSAEGLKHEFTVVVAAAEIEKQIQDRLAEIGRSVRLPGFRPGKAPLALLKKRYGPSVMGEVVERAVNDSSSAAIKEHKLRPALQPKIEIVSFNEGKDLEYKLAVEVLPDIGPVSLDGIALERWKADVPDSEIDQALERIAKQQRKTAPVERAADKGDFVRIDFKGAIAGVAFPGGSADNYLLELGSGGFIPGFEDQLVGSKAGDARTVAVTFPADYGNAELAGKAAEFAVTVKEVRQAEAQPIDESLAAAVGMENLAELRQAVRERIEREYSGITRQRLKRELLDQLAARFSFAVPAGMLDLEFQHLWREVEAERQRAKEGGAPDPEASKNDVELKAEFQALSERRVRLGLLLNEIGRTNSLTVTAEELNRAVIERARSFPGQEREVLDFYRNNPQALDSLRAPIYEDKVVDFILGKVNVTERAVPPAELTAAGTQED